MAESAWARLPSPACAAREAICESCWASVFLFFFAHRLHLFGEFLYRFRGGLQVADLRVFAFCHGLQLGRHGFQRGLALPALGIELLAQVFFQLGKVGQRLLAVAVVFAQLFGQFGQLPQQLVALFRAHFFGVLNLLVQLFDLFRLAVGLPSRLLCARR